MGFELNKLMQQYGLATPTMLSYEGERGPDIEVIDEETGEVTTTPGEITFDPAKQRAFDQYQTEYQFRLNNAPMYAGSQFQTQTTPQPMSYMQMYQQYLGRDPTDQERTEAIGLDAKITEDNPLSLAQRQQFLRRFEDEFKNLGIRNTGNQAVMDTIGNYYGNILRNPDYSPTPIDRSLPFAERFPNRPNPNPPYTGPIITVEEAYFDPDNPPVPEGQAFPGGEVSQTFQDFSAQQQQNLANIANPLPDETLTSLEIARTVDPFAESSIRGVPAYGAYLAKNQDVFNNILARPEYQALPKGPGATPEQIAAVDDFMAQAAKDHFVNSGFQEGRQFYKTGGPVKGYTRGGQYQSFNDPMYGEVVETVNTEIDPEYGADVSQGIVNPLGLNVMIQEQTGLTEADGPSVTAPQMQDNTDALEKLLANLTTNTYNPYKPVLESLSGKVGEAQTVYDQQLEALLANTRKGPDKAELYFNLAAALSAPTKTGTFGESLGLAAKQFGKFAADSRKMEQSADALKLKQAEAKLKTLQARYQKIEDKVSDEAVRNQEQQFKIAKMLSDRGIKGQELLIKMEKIKLDKDIAQFNKTKPLSEFGQRAKDEGLTPGTQAFNLRVETLGDEADLRKAQENNKMPSHLAKIANEKVTAANIARSSMGQLRRALELNENAYAGDLFGYTMEQFKSLLGSDELKLVNTRILRNILSNEALQKLKATFGGQISDGERQALSDLSGVTSRSTEERKRIITNALKVLDRVSHNAQKDVEWFGSPSRFKAPFEGYAQYQLENFRFADDDVRRSR